MHSDVSRRTFVKAGVAAAAAGLAAPRAHGANGRIRAGFIGVGNRGGQLIEAALPHKDRLDIVAVCDVYEPFCAKWADQLEGDVAQYTDFRELLERDDVDAVFIATPDHWHAIQTIMACEAGKDVYIEKPLSMTAREGRRMVDAARRHNRVVQVGTHRRSSEMYAELAGLLQDGAAGHITVSRSYRINNMWPEGIGRLTATSVPEGLDWDLWLGPRPERPYQDNIAPYKFRWWNLYSSQLGNWGVHYFDLIRWLIGEEAPMSVSCHGGVYAVNDDRSIPDTLHATFELPSGHLMLFGQYEASGNPIFARSAEIELRGTKGTVYAGARGYEILPEKGGQFQSTDPYMEPMSGTDKGSNANLTSRHVGNFLDCIVSREKPTADVEDGHKSTLFSHLGNIALATRSRIDWDPVAERITNNEEANDLLDYAYRPPWTQ